MSKSAQRYVVSVFIAAGTAAPAALGQAFSWTNPVNSIWSNAAAWTPNGVPNGAGDEATIDVSGVPYLVTLDIDALLDAFTLDSADATLDMGVRDLTIAVEANLLAGRLIMDGGAAIGGAGTVTNSAVIDSFRNNTISAPLVQSGALNIISGPAGFSAALTIANGFSNDGTITLTSQDNIRTASLTVTTGTLTNDGTIDVNNGAGGSRLISANLDNNADFNANTSLSLGGNTTVYTNSGTFDVAPSATVTLDGTGELRFEQAAGTLDNQGTFRVTATERFDFTGGTITGNAVEIDQATLGITGAGAGAFNTRRESTFDGDVAAAQTVNVISGVAGSSAMLTSADGFTNDGTMNLTSQDNIRTTTVAVTAGTLVNNGSLNLQQGAGGERRLSTDLTNNGNVNADAVVLLNKSSGVYTNNASFDITAASTVTMNGTGEIRFEQAAGTLDNQGAFFVTSTERFDFTGGTITGNAIELDQATLGITATGAGAFNTRRETTFDGDVAAAQTVNVISGVAGSSAMLTSADGFTNDGTMNLTSQDNIRTTTVAVTAGTLVNNGSLNLQQGAGGERRLLTDLVNNGTVDADTAVLLNKPSGVYTNNASFDIDASSIVTMNGTGELVFEQAAGTLDNQGAFQVSSTERFDFTGGTITGNAIELDQATLGITATGAGAFNVRRGSTLDGNVAAAQTVNVIAGVAGTSSTMTSAVGFTNDGTINLLDQDNSRTASVAVTAGTLVNNGEINMLPAAGGTSTINASLDNQGTIDVDRNTVVNASGGVHSNSGSIVLRNGRTFSINATAAPQFVNQPGGRIEGNGVLDITDTDLVFEQNGVIAPGLSAGSLTLLGDFLPAVTAALEIEIGGLSAGVDFDELTVSGDAELGGQLVVSLLPGFTPDPSDTFTILTAADVSGVFQNAPVTVSTTGGGVFEVTYNETSVVLSNYVPTPGAGGLAMCAAFTLIRRRRG